jgi:hypothetical protein
MRTQGILMLSLLTISLAFLCSAFMVDTANCEKIYGIYDMNWNLKYYMTGDAAYDTEWILRYYIRNNALYDKNWLRRYFIKGAEVYNERWFLQYRIKEYKPHE